MFVQTPRQRVIFPRTDNMLHLIGVRMATCNVKSISAPQSAERFIAGAFHNGQIILT